MTADRRSGNVGRPRWHWARLALSTPCQAEQVGRRAWWHVSCTHWFVLVGTYAHKNGWRQDERLSTI